MYVLRSIDPLIALDSRYLTPPSETIHLTTNPTTSTSQAHSYHHCMLNIVISHKVRSSPSLRPFFFYSSLLL